MGRSREKNKLVHLEKNYINIMKRKLLSVLPHLNLKEQEVLDSKKHLTIGKVSNFRRKGDIIEVIILDVQIYVLLCLRCFKESHEPGSERCHEDGEHPKVQQIPEMHHVFPWTLLPDLLAL